MATYGAGGIDDAFSVLTPEAATQPTHGEELGSMSGPDRPRDVRRPDPPLTLVRTTASPIPFGRAHRVPGEPDASLRVMTLCHGGVRAAAGAAVWDVGVRPDPER